MDHHFIKKCSKCKTVIIQCRCPSPDKIIEWVDCGCKVVIETEPILYERAGEYVIRTAANKYIKPDDSSGPMSSGGYPTLQESPLEGKFWEKKEEAEAYLKACKSEAEREGWQIHEVKIKVEFVREQG